MLSIKLRTAAKSEFDKDSFRLINNSVFGKTLGNIMKHNNVKQVKSRELLKDLVKPNFDDGHALSKELFAVEMDKTKIKMEKPVYLGLAALNLRKTLMYEFYYDYMQSKY